METNTTENNSTILNIKCSKIGDSIRGCVLEENTENTTNPYYKDSNVESIDNSNQYDKLLNEFSQSRKDLKKLLNDVEDCKNSVLKSVTDSNDYRNKYAREERLKTLSSFFDTTIKIRQEYNRSILAEIDVRRKLDMKDDGEIEVDIKEIYKQLSELNKKNKQ